jgi:hypothetical protein
MQSFAAKHGPLQDDKKEDETVQILPDALEEIEKDSVVLKKDDIASDKKKQEVKEKTHKRLEKLDKVDNEQLHYAAIAGFGKKQSDHFLLLRCIRKYRYSK